MIDAFVAAYLKGSEEELDRKAEVQAEVRDHVGRDGVGMDTGPGGSQ